MDLITLRTAFNVNFTFTSYQDRLEQYLDGLKTFFDFYNKYNCKTPIMIIDNTINDKGIDKNILNIIPENVIFKIFNSNVFGSLNKGAGLIESWLYLQDDLLKYDNIIHFEPRLKLLDFNFFESYFNNPRNLFTTNNTIKHFNTGLFTLNSNVLIEFSKSINLKEMTEQRISIEYIIYDYIFDHNISYDIVDKMGVIWHDEVQKKSLYM
jgi:hypothetical protein